MTPAEHERGSMSAEERVRAAWQECEHKDTALGVLAGPHYIVIGNAHREWWRAFYGHTESAAWSAALAFTEQRREEIRQLRRDRIRVAGRCEDYRLHIDCEMESDPDDYENRYGDDQSALIVEWVSCLCSEVRILARLEAALAEKLQGWKEQG